MNSNRPLKVKKVAVVGPECTGKSDLSEFLATYYKTNWVPEYARGYLENLVRPYQEHDLLTIARGQLRLEDKYEKDSNEFMVCDTNLYVIKVWSEFKFGRCHPEILNHIETRKYDLYLLTNIDLPWVADAQREHPDRREELYKIYWKEMKNQPVPCVEIKGQGDQRRQMAMEAIDKLVIKK
jgi:NadR type nicotinamide-nucleotide adenylyltransferase